MSLAAGTSFASYRILEPLGRGGMASVYKAYEAALDRYVAVKVLPAEFLHDPTFAERFNREARVVARLEHPNVIPIYAFGIAPEPRIPWMAMRLIAGGSLAEVLRGSRERLPFERSVAILRGVAEALDYAHGKGVVHRDVKPQNILLDEGGHVYLADFGIAKMVAGSSGLTQTGMISGTPQYMAPEQATALAVDPRADVYALGIVAYEMFTGRVPFVADTPVAVLMKQVSETLPLPAPGEVPEGLVRPILKCTAKKPDERFASSTEFVRALEDALAEARAGTPPLPAAPTQDLRREVPPTLRSAPTAPGPPPATPPGAEARTWRPATPTVSAPPPPGPARGRPAPTLIVAGVLGAGLLFLIAAGGAGYLWVRGSPSAPPSPVAPSPYASVGVAGGESPLPVPVVEPEATAPSTPVTPAPPRPLTPAPVLRATPSMPPTAPPEPPPARPSEPPRALETPVPVAPGPAPEVRPLVDQLKTGDKDERWHAAERLGNLRQDARFVVPALAAALRDRNEDVRWRAAEALGKFGPEAGDAVQALIGALEGPDIVASEAAKSLGKLGPAARPGVPALGNALGRTDVYARREAAKALARLGPVAAAAVPALIDALRDKDKAVRAVSAEALGRIGLEAKSAVPALEAASRDPDGLVRSRARDALRSLGSER